MEMGMGGLAVDDRVRIGLVSVTPGTGEVVWDEFDGQSLSARIKHPGRGLMPQIRKFGASWRRG